MIELKGVAPQAMYRPNGFFSYTPFTDGQAMFFATPEEAAALVKELSQPLPERVMGASGYTELAPREFRIQAPKLIESGMFGEIRYASTEKRRPYEIYGTVEVQTPEGPRMLTFAENVGVQIRQREVVQGDSRNKGQWCLALWPQYEIASLHWWRPGAGVW